jgi:hypothetical protein
MIQARPQLVTSQAGHGSPNTKCLKKLGYNWKCSLYKILSRKGKGCMAKKCSKWNWSKSTWRGIWWIHFNLHSKDT